MKIADFFIILGAIWLAPYMSEFYSIGLGVLFTIVGVVAAFAELLSELEKKGK